jgi:hypothetical protein
MGVEYSTHGRYEKLIHHFGWKPEVERQRGRSIWDNIIKMDFRGIFCVDVDWILLTQDF